MQSQTFPSVPVCHPTPPRLRTTAAPPIPPPAAPRSLAEADLLQTQNHQFSDLTPCQSSGLRQEPRIGFLSPRCADPVGAA